MSALKSKVPYLRNLHYNWLESDLCKVQGGRRDGFEAGDGGFDAVLQFSEGGFVVFEDGVGLLEDADAIPFYGVGEGLDLVGETGGMLALLVERGIEVVRRGNVGEGLTASCHLASGTLVFLVGVGGGFVEHFGRCRGTESSRGWTDHTEKTC